MDSKEFWATCGQCGQELQQNDKNCPECGSTQKIHYVKTTERMIAGDFISEVRHKRKGFKKYMVQIINRWLPSGDPKLKDGIREERIIDKEKNEYHQICKDAKTEDVTHEEHPPLNQHK